MVRLLGKGAQARVYLAWDTRLTQWRAIKVLAANYVNDDHVRQRFETEAEAMARLSHRNLLRVVDVAVDGGTPYIVMELARCGSVTDWLKRYGPMPPKLACSVVAQACDGLAHAHSVGVVHRDVKPHNLLVAEDGRILLTDFGIAQLAEGLSMTQTGSVMGTFAYMSPEQRNDAKSVDGRADVYSLGATLYTMLTMKTSAELFFAEARPEILGPVIEPLRPVILDACRYHREDRLATVMALRERLEEIIECLEDEDESPAITADVLEVPEKPPALLGEESGVEDLQKVLALRDADAPTYIPRGRLDELLEDQHTTLYSDTSFDDQQPTTIASPEQAASVEAPGMELSTMDHPGSQAAPTHRVVPMADALLDVSSLNQAPPVDRGRTAPAPPARAVEPAAVHTAEPAGAREPSLLEQMDLRWMAAGMLLTMAFLAALLCVGLADKYVASTAYNESSAALVSSAQRQKAVIGTLVDAGADPTPLERLWFKVQDVPVAEKAARAAIFVDAVGLAAEKVEINALAREQVNRLQSAKRDWEITADALREARAGFLARFSGDFGVVPPE